MIVNPQPTPQALGSLGHPAERNKPPKTRGIDFPYANHTDNKQCGGYHGDRDPSSNTKRGVAGRFGG